jgi:uncharacterized protein (DUF2249 family)
MSLTWIKETRISTGYTAHMSFQSGQKDFSPTGSRDAIPEALREALVDGRLVELDVRPLLEAGQEPFMAIMRSVDQLKAGEALQLYAPFEPVPLFAVLGRKGFNHWTRPPSEAGGAWEIFFFRETGVEEEEVDFPDDDSDSDAEDVMELDVRGLEPPEPLERVMEAAEQLAYGDILRVHHHRNPLILFDLLDERGFVHRSEEVESDHWEVRIWRKA